MLHVEGSFVFETSLISSNFGSSEAGSSDISSLWGKAGLIRGRDFVIRVRRNLQMAFRASSRITTLHRTFSPFLLAAISHSNSVYWIICRNRAVRR